MKKTAIHARKLSLEDFPVLPRHLARQDSAIVDYLETLSRQSLSPAVHYLELPSMSVLSDFFKCSFLTMYDAFRLLRDRGYEYQFSSLDGAMLVWRQANCK